MKIKLTVKHETEINIELPIFYKRPTEGFKVDEYLGVLDDDHVINLYIGDSYESLNHATVENYKDKMLSALILYTPLVSTINLALSFINL